jgi:lysophospholipase L1-like esterase
VATLVTVLVTSRPVVLHAAAATASPSAPPQVHQVHTVAFIGDSWTVGEGTTGLNGYAALASEQLGWLDRPLGVGGSGYDQPGGPSAGATYDQRVDHAVIGAPDVIVVEGSLNERRSTPEALFAAADQTFAHLKAAADPHTKILVLGATYSPGTPNATIDWINASIKAAADRHGLQFVDPAAERWLDPDDPSEWYNPDHPNDAGAQIVADRLKPLLLSLVGS